MRRLVDYFDPSSEDLRAELRRALEAHAGREPAEEGRLPSTTDDAVVLSTERVRRDGVLIDISGVKGLHRRIKLLDMESWGFASGVGDDHDWLVVRGISDHGDEEKDDDCQRAASVAAIVAAKVFIEQMYLPEDESRL